MRELLLLLPVLVAGDALAGRWVPLSENISRAVYIDSAAVVRDGAWVRTWVREVYTEEQRSEQVGVYFHSANSLVSYDCTRRTWAPLFKVFYGGDGTELRRVSLDAVEAPALAAPGSLQEGLLERACAIAAQSEEKERAAADGPTRLAVAAVKPTAVSAAPETGKALAVEKTQPATAEDELQPKQTVAQASAELPKSQAGPTTKTQPQSDTNARDAARANASPGSVRPVAEMRPQAGSVGAWPTPYQSRARPARNAKPKVRPPSAPQTAEEVHWSYTGAGAPEHWGKLKAEYSPCASGQRQSPIDLQDGARLELEPIRFDYQPSPLRIVDDGHTVQVNYAEGSSISVAGERYELKQFHFHKPSEERIAGRRFAMVAHLVHANAEGRLAVVAILFEARQQSNPFLRQLWPHLPLEPQREAAPDASINANALLPETRTYFAYVGSLTTPPCTEGVLWMVMKTPLEMSPEQVAVFSKLYSMNARPVQPANGRLIKESM